MDSKTCDLRRNMTSTALLREIEPHDPESVVS